MAFRANFFVLGGFFKKLFYIDKLSRRDISDFQAETKHNDSHYVPNKGRQVKKERRKEMLAWLLPPRTCQSACDLSKLLPLWLSCHRGGHSVTGKLARCSQGHQPPALDAQYNPHHSKLHLCCKNPRNTEQSLTNCNKSHSPHCTNKIIFPPFLP